MAGIKEQLLTDMVTRALPLLRTEVETGLKALVCSELYLTGIKEGALRYDAQGVPVATVTKKEALNAQLKLISIVQKKYRPRVPPGSASAHASVHPFFFICR